MIELAGEKLEKKPPTNRPTIEKIPPRPKAPAGGGGHSKDEEAEMGAKVPDKQTSKVGDQNKKESLRKDLLGAGNIEGKATEKAKPRTVERQLSKVSPKLPLIPRKP